ncbi:hypothetical protein Tco_1327583 [Tanacetum coccineum]
MFGSNTIKLDRMDGMNFTRWNEKMKFMLTAFKVYYVMEEQQIGILTKEEHRKHRIHKHLRIEEETRIREKNLNGASSFKVNYVDSGKNNKGNDKNRKGIWNFSKDNKKPLFEVVSYKCGDKGHIKRYCKNPKKKNQNSNKKDESANKLHIASVTTTTDDWWYDSGATTHVCNNKDLFKTYKETGDGHEVMMGDNHTSKVIGSGNMENTRLAFNQNDSSR